MHWKTTLGLWLALVAMGAMAEAHPGHVELNRLEKSDADHLHLHRELQAHHVDVLLQMGEGQGATVGMDAQLKPVELKNWGYTQFVGTLGIGTPAQKMRVIYDTGSSNTWLPGHACNEASCDKYGKYDHHKSHTFEELKEAQGLGESRKPSFYIKYGSGLVRGKVIQDDVTLGGIKLKKARFGEVGYEHGHAFRKGHFSGIVGLAFPSLAAANMYPLFDQVIDQKVLKTNEFAFYLSNRIDNPSKLMLGDSAEGSWKGDLTSHDVIENNYWSVRMADVMVGDERLNICPQDGCKVAVDSGTSLVTGPSSHVSHLLRKLDIKHNCDNWDGIKPFSLLLEATRKDGSKYLKKYQLHKNEFVFEMKNQQGKRKACTPGLMALDVPKPRGPLWILGDLFMMKYFTQYNRNTNQVKIGLANHKTKMQEEEEEESEMMTSSMLSRMMALEEEESQQQGQVVELD
jgi:hypothetical protein